MSGITVVAATAPAVVVVAAGRGLQGPPGPPGPAGGATAPFTQATPSLVWTVPHNLGRFPNVTVADTANNVVVADVTYIDNNIVRITHGSAQAGFVYCN